MSSSSSLLNFLFMSLTRSWSVSSQVSCTWRVTCAEARVNVRARQACDDGGHRLTFDVVAPEEVNSLGVYAATFASVAASLGSSSKVTSSGTNLIGRRTSEMSKSEPCFQV